MIASYLGTVLLAISLSKASQINVTMGQSVLLHCAVDPPPPPQNTRVYWQTEEVNGKVLVVHFVNMGKEEDIYQDSLYKHRTALDLSQLSAGNYSLVLKNVTKKDNQTTFLCFYSSNKLLPIKVSRVTLTVLDRPAKPVWDNKSDKPDKSDSVPLTFWATGPILGLLLLVACVAVSIYKVRGKKPELSSNTGTEANGRVNYEENEKLALNGTEKSFEDRRDIV